MVLGGCETPTESIKLIKMALEDKNKRKSIRNRKRSVIIDLNTEESDVKSNVLSSNESNDIFEDTFTF